MIPVTELDNIARARLGDAKTLLAEAKVKQNHFALWNTIAVWKVESRYNVIGTAKQANAVAMIQAADELLAVL